MSVVGTISTAKESRNRTIATSGHDPARRQADVNPLDGVERDRRGERGHRDERFGDGNPARGRLTTIGEASGHGAPARGRS